VRERETKCKLVDNQEERGRDGKRRTGREFNEGEREREKTERLREISREGGLQSEGRGQGRGFALSRNTVIYSWGGKQTNDGRCCVRTYWEHNTEFEA